MIPSSRYVYQYLVSVELDNDTPGLPITYGKSINLSQSGLGLEFNGCSALNIGDAVTLRLQFGDSFLDSSSLMLTAKVVWKKNQHCGLELSDAQGNKNRTLYQNLLDGFEALSKFRPLSMQE